jgi:hypothetical protein
LLTTSEHKFFRQLCEALPEYEVIPQVCMGAIIEPPERYYGEVRERARRTYQAKMVDFTVWDASHNEIVCLVELDDASHDDRKEQDNARDAIVGQAGYRLARVDVRRLPSTTELRERVLRAKVPDIPLPEPARRKQREDDSEVQSQGSGRLGAVLLLLAGLMLAGYVLLR